MGRIGSGVLCAALIFSLGLLGLPKGATASPNPKFTVCTITINSDNEAKLFKKKLRPSLRYEFIELVPPHVDPGKKGESDGRWFEQACTRLRAEKKSCDLLIVSGHFGGTFFGSSGRTLALETLEQMGCNEACPGIMNAPKEVFLFGCNTLAKKGVDTRTPAQYRAVLRTEVNEQGDRVFTDVQVDEIVAFRYSEFGQSNQERMSRAFANVPHLYGFDSIAPSGKNSEGSLSRYLQAIPDYGAHLEEVELKQAVGKAIEGQRKVSRINQKIATAFKTTNFAQCSGDPMQDVSVFCSVFDEKTALSTRLSTLHGMLAGPGGAKYLALGKQFFERYSPQSYGADSKAEFDRISQDPVIRDRFLSTLTALGSLPTFALDLTELGQKLAWLSPGVVLERRQAILAQLINAGTIEAKDLVCSRERWPPISIAALKSRSWSNKNSLLALTCVAIEGGGSALSARSALNSALNSARNSKEFEHRLLGAWIVGEVGSQDPGIQKSLVALLDDQNLSVRRMAASALYRSKPKSPEILEALAKRMGDTAEDSVIRRDAALALFYAGLSGEKRSASVEAALQKAAADGDPILPRIAERIRGLPTSTPQEPLPALEKEGDAIVTSARVRFERVTNPKTGEKGWRDTQTQLIWYDAVHGMKNQYSAEMDCALKPGQALPSQGDFALAEQHGIREVVKDMRAHIFWSASLYPNYTEGARGFHGDYGVSFIYFRGYDGSVRCVAR